jgi:hypothetical protein
MGFLIPRGAYVAAVMYVKLSPVSRCLIQNHDLTYAMHVRFHQQMKETPSEISSLNLLLEPEVAILLRCSPGKVKRLRLARKLTYFRGRPVLISENDLEKYVAGAKRRSVLPRGEPPKARQGEKRRLKKFEYLPVGAAPRPFRLLTVAEAAAKFERTPTQIKYLCLNGSVPYLPGRPAVIEEADIAEYFQKKHAAERAKIPPAPDTPEFDAHHNRIAKGRAAKRLYRKKVIRQVARILAEMGGRKRT